MESILARALEYTLKYWLKSFSRDQFKLQGRTVQLSNLDINGDALHSSVGLPPAINVKTAKVGKLEIVLPSVSNVQVEPVIVQIDRLDLVLEENPDADVCRSPTSSQSPSSSGKGSGYGFADKIADGMTVEIRTVNLLLETRGGARRQGGASWVSPLASITIRGLLLYTTNEHWEVVNLKEARDFSANNKYIYLFKKLEWQSLSIDLLPHPDMFMDGNVACSQDGGFRRDNDGAKRAFFGGERFIEGISGEAYITVQRTELNSPVGLEVQLHITEAVCPALSEPGLRALLRFLTGLYVCLNRGDVDTKAQQRSTEAAGRSHISIVVDHIFLCIKDTEFQLELLIQSLLFSRASISDGENDNNLTKVLIAGLFLRDTFSRPPCTLVQPSMLSAIKEPIPVPEFAKNFCPPIYPFGEQKWQLIEGVPLLCLHSLQIKPSPVPPAFASQTNIDCQPLMVDLQESSCLRICSFLADGVVVSPGSILSDFSINSLVFNLKELDVTVPLDPTKSSSSSSDMDTVESPFSGAILHIENLFFSESPSLKLKQLKLDKDPACFCLWPGQPVDASQKKWTIGASQLSLCLETSSGQTGPHQSSLNQTSGQWRCVELKGARVEVAMVTADGSPLTTVPPPGGIVRVGVACEQYVSNTSVEQLFFVLDLYAYFGSVSEKIVRIGKTARKKKISKRSYSGKLMDNAPCDTGVSLIVKDLQLRFLESSPVNIQGMPLVKFVGNDLFIKVAHRTLGGAIVVSSNVRWDNVEVDCVDTEGNFSREIGLALPSDRDDLITCGNGYPQLKAVLWVDNQRSERPTGSVDPFLDINIEHVIPLDEIDIECHSLNASACVSGLRLGGGMNYAEALLHRFGILGPDGGPGKGLSKGIENLREGPLSKLFKTSSLAIDSSDDDGSSSDRKDSGLLHLGKPDDVDVSIELKNWLFALEGAQEMAESWWFSDRGLANREGRCWHTTFQNLRVKAKSSPKSSTKKDKSHGLQKYPVELVTVGIDGLQTLKPRAQKTIHSAVSPVNGIKETVQTHGGINVEARIMVPEASTDVEMKWIVENMKFSVKEPIEATVTKDELQHLAFLCKSEVDSMGRITAGIIRLLKLEGSIGQAAMDQLSNLGSGGIDKIFSQERLGAGGAVNGDSENPQLSAESIVASLEETVIESKAKCDALVTCLVDSDSDSDSSSQLATINELTQKLEGMQSLLTKLRSQI